MYTPFHTALQLGDACLSGRSPVGEMTRGGRKEERARERESVSFLTNRPSDFALPSGQLPFGGG